MPAPRPALTENRVPNHLTTLSLPAVIRDPGAWAQLSGLAIPDKLPAGQALEGIAA
jgi:hypothetical protein